MVKEVSSDLPLFLLFVAALCLDQSALSYYSDYHMSSSNFRLSDVMMNWTEAQQSCQKNFSELAILWPSAEGHTLLELAKHNAAWIGLYRDPSNSSVWRWAGTREDASQNRNWAKGEQTNECTYIDKHTKKWHSRRCSEKHSFYCTQGQSQGFFVGAAKTWYDARETCQERLFDLAIVTQQNEFRFDKSGWIGLYREKNTLWKWSGKEQSNYINWAPNEPSTADCGSIDFKTKQLHSTDCSKKLKSVCYHHNVVLVKQNKTWEEALEHCRAMEHPRYGVQLYDLLSHSYSSMEIQEATTNEVWIGLRMLAGEWLQLNGRLPLTEHLPRCPAQGQHCGALSKESRAPWEARDCEERRNFLCYKNKIIVTKKNST